MCARGCCCAFFASATGLQAWWLAPFKLWQPRMFLSRAFMNWPRLAYFASSAAGRPKLSRPAFLKKLALKRAKMNSWTSQRPWLTWAWTLTSWMRGMTWLPWRDEHEELLARPLPSFALGPMTSCSSLGTQLLIALLCSLSSFASTLSRVSTWLKNPLLTPLGGSCESFVLPSHCTISLDDAGDLCAVTCAVFWTKGRLSFCRQALGTYSVECMWSGDLLRTACRKNRLPSLQLVFRKFFIFSRRRFPAVDGVLFASMEDFVYCWENSSFDSMLRSHVVPWQNLKVKRFFHFCLVYFVFLVFALQPLPGTKFARLP